MRIIYDLCMSIYNLTRIDAFRDIAQAVYKVESTQRKVQNVKKNVEKAKEAVQKKKAS